MCAHGKGTCTCKCVLMGSVCAHGKVSVCAHGKVSVCAHSNNTST